MSSLGNILEWRAIPLLILPHDEQLTSKSDRAHMILPLLATIPHAGSISRLLSLVLPQAICRVGIYCAFDGLQFACEGEMALKTDGKTNRMLVGNKAEGC